jgi:hypothetical protein
LTHLIQLRKPFENALGDTNFADFQFFSYPGCFSPSTSLVDTSPAVFLTECTKEFDRPIRGSDDRADWFNFWSYYDLSRLTSSDLYMHNMACSFEQCYPKPNSLNTTLSDRHFGFTILLSGAANFVVNAMMLLKIEETRWIAWCILHNYSKVVLPRIP